jgi:hypothetical protein
MKPPLQNYRTTYSLILLKKEEKKKKYLPHAFFLSKWIQFRNNAKRETT